ncbi:MAG: NAD(P)H-dependent oxidoreductase subunit E [Clostridiales bacterium]|nr:NAD(P)H-dependent oxidoreductase subunit E [Clostridiales bacterium]
MMCNCECNDKKQKLLEIIEKYKNDKSNLMQVLHEAQEVYGYLPLEVQKEISLGMGIPMAEIYGVVTFYSRFSLEPKGKYNIAVCLGTACYVKGSEAIINKFKEKLGIDVGQCTKDGKFSLEATRCIGACGLAPVFTVNEEVYGKATLETVDKVLEEYMNKE